MKKVFSVKKFEECCKRLGLPNEEFEKSCEIWANRCDGLTKEEMNELGYVFNDNWAIEVEERKEKLTALLNDLLKQLEAVIDHFIFECNEYDEEDEEIKSFIEALLYIEEVILQQQGQPIIFDKPDFEF